MTPQERIQAQQKAIALMLDWEAKGTLEPDTAELLGNLRQEGIVPPQAQAPQPEGALDAAMISAGKTTTDLGLGLKDLYGRVTDDPQMRNEVAADVTEGNRNLATVSEANPVASFAGSMLPYFAIPMGAGAAATSRVPEAAYLASKIPGGAATAEAMLLGTGIGAVDPNQSALMGAAGGAAGGMGAAALARLLSPGATARAGTEKALAAADKLGYKVMPSQLSTGGRGAKIMEGTIDSNPVTAGAIGSVIENNQAVGARVARAALGEEAGETITDEVLGAARVNIGQRFEDLTQGATVQMDDSLMRAIADIEDSYMATWGASNPLKGVLDDALEEAASSGGQMTGRRYQNLRSMLAKESKAAMAQDPQRGRALGDVREALDEAMERSLGGEAAAGFRQARQQWRDLLTLESPGVVNTGEGTLSPAVLGNKLRQRDPRGFQSGRNNSDLYNLGRIGQAFKPLQSSGTGERVGGMGVLGMLGLGGGAHALDVLPEALTTLAGGRGLAELYTRAGTPFMRNTLVGSQGRLPAAGGRVGAALFGEEDVLDLGTIYGQDPGERP